MKAYGDIVRLDIVDSYSDLSGKTLKMFSVLPQKIDADFYFKVDDDVAVNIDAMETYLTAQRKHGNLYLVSHALVLLSLAPVVSLSGALHCRPDTLLAAACPQGCTIPILSACLAVAVGKDLTAERLFAVRRAITSN